MVRTRQRAISPGHQESRNASSNPLRDRQSTPIGQPPSIQHIQSMAATMVELTCQNQKLTREISLMRQRHKRHAEGQAQSQEVGEGEKIEPENQSWGTASWRVPHLEREMDQMRKAMDEMKENIRRENLVDDSIHRTNSPFMAFINSHPLPSKFKMSSLDSYDEMHDPCDHIATFKTTMHLQGVPNDIIRGFQTILCVGPSRPPLKGQHECGSIRYLQIL